MGAIQPLDPPRFFEAMARFVAVHRQDPRTVIVLGVSVPWSLHYHARLTHWLGKLWPKASEPMLLSAQCQHLRRWTILRKDFANGTTGYKQWRSTLGRFHAAEAGQILTAVGYEDDVVTRVADFLLKRGLKSDPEIRAFEDAICMTFFENEFADLAGRYDDGKVVDILKKTWLKMSPEGQAAARGLAVDLSVRLQQLVERATG